MVTCPLGPVRARLPCVTGLATESSLTTDATRAAVTAFTTGEIERQPGLENRLVNWVGEVQDHGATLPTGTALAAIATGTPAPTVAPIPGLVNTHTDRVRVRALGPMATISTVSATLTEAALTALELELRQRNGIQ